MYIDVFVPDIKVFVFVQRSAVKCARNVKGMRCLYAMSKLGPNYC